MFKLISLIKHGLKDIVKLFLTIIQIHFVGQIFYRVKKSLFIALILISAVTEAATYYVATNGSDSNPGTLSQPWLTIQKGFNSISPGDILYIRGGNLFTLRHYIRRS